ncbi:LPS export ABC transporter permease LptG [Microbulbifer flavimaris]|uniref:LPS export ABC transporter permease LptG n=1 Tax=Microbulbifer flavimaris TaxID=1781068 RepID=A0ABX4HWP3_9GAMM|nr:MULTISPECIES: LPS export ABC transporter permease LptG [Microbulbifer]KUJ81532.1 LPS export ABC transporter permease LptG [Microbulbifer sp. ZGT114]PCO04436.1 LPS export ABC transporter permease LptG [Microbulbifer flavimaris]
MHKLDWYVGRTVAMAIGAVLMVILGLDIIFAIVDELGEMDAEYQTAQVIQYVIWTIPGRLYEQLGFSALVGCMVGLGTLAGTSELTVMRAAGVSIGRIAWAVMKPVILLIALGLALAEFVVPITNQTAESRKAIALGDLEDAGLESGMWMRDGDEFIHFNAALSGGRLYGITRYHFGGERELEWVEFAERAQFAEDKWILNNSRATRFSEEFVESDARERGTWQTDISPQLFSLVVPLPSDLSPSSLWSYGRFLDRKAQDASRYWLQFWKKLLQPLTIASLVMVAISFIFGPLREVTTGLRVFTGVIVGIVFQTLQDMLGPSSVVFGFPPFIAVLVPILLCFAVGWMLLRRAR